MSINSITVSGNSYQFKNLSPNTNYTFTFTINRQGKRRFHTTQQAISVTTTNYEYEKKKN